MLEGEMQHKDSAGNAVSGATHFTTPEAHGALQFTCCSPLQLQSCQYSLFIMWCIWLKQRNSPAGDALASQQALAVVQDPLLRVGYMHVHTWHVTRLSWLHGTCISSPQHLSVLLLLLSCVQGVIDPGGVQWMIAGCGLVQSDIDPSVLLLLLLSVCPSWASSAQVACSG
jgi:hypothetical protein